ncbi:MAG: hypothetical protein EBS01_12770, partial [Verrucomicrobia bacterium]|nr:hypothetical protein [Verrucomicrobiota bacterium]
MDHKGRIAVSDLKTYLAQRVMELTGGAQKPSVVAFERDQDFDLVGEMPPLPDTVKLLRAKQSNAAKSEAKRREQEADMNQAFSSEEREAGLVFKNSLSTRFRWCPP